MTRRVRSRRDKNATAARGKVAMTLNDPLNNMTSAAPGDASATKAPLAQSHFIECGVCGYEPPEQMGATNELCPKCGGRHWRRCYRPDHVTTATKKVQPFQTPRTGSLPALANVIRESNRVYLPHATVGPVPQRTRSRA